MKTDVLVTFMTVQTPHKKQLTGGRAYFGSQFKGIVRLFWQWEGEVAGHITATVRKQRTVSTGTQLAFSFVKGRAFSR